MIKKYKFFILLAGLFIALIVVQILTPKPISWHISLSKKDKNPYGAYVLHDLLPGAFPESQFNYITLPVMETDSAGDENIFILANSFYADSSDVVSMLRRVEKGSTIMIAASRMYGGLADTLKIEMADSELDDVLNLEPGVLSDSLGLKFTNTSLATKQPYYFEKSTVYSYFSAWDTSRATILAQNANEQPVLMSIPWGKGSFLLSSTPLVFTNYHLLRTNRSHFAEGILSYLDDKDLIWSSYYQLGRQEAATPLRYVLSQPSLKWAYYLTIFGVFLFIVFEGKRRQRPIPVVAPLANDTVEFAELVGALYLEHGNHRALAEKKIIYLLEHIRTEWHLTTDTIDEAFCKNLASRSGRDEVVVNKLFKTVRKIKQLGSITAEELMHLNKQIEDFYKKA